MGYGLVVIVCSLGYGYVSKFLLRELCCSGVTSIGITSKIINKQEFSQTNLNICSIYETKKSISFSTHLVITAPPTDNGCPIYAKYTKDIINSNISNIAYISSTSVYGNNKGNWVNESSDLKGKSRVSANRKLAEKQWIKFCLKHKISYNIFRLGAIYGPDRLNSFGKIKKIIRKKGHYFSRIHVYDISRIVTKILLTGYKNNIWNLVDNLPSSRESYLLEIANLKKIRNYKIVDYKDEKNQLSKNIKAYWQNNKKVSNLKIKEKTNLQFIFSNYKAGLKNLLG